MPTDRMASRENVLAISDGLALVCEVKGRLAVDLGLITSGP